MVLPSKARSAISYSNTTLVKVKFAVICVNALCPSIQIQLLLKLNLARFGISNILWKIQIQLLLKLN